MFFTDYCELLIPGLRLWISLGCSLEERANVQPVDVDIRIRFSQEPLGCGSDQLTDVVCYQTVVEHLVESTKGQSFNLIESLAAHIFDCVVKQLNLSDTLVEITVVKPHHPVSQVQKGIAFKYCRRVSQNSL
jgi:dihydroneopterin aldolase